MKNLTSKSNKLNVIFGSLGVISIISILFIMIYMPSDNLKLEFGPIYPLNDSWTYSDTSQSTSTINLPVYLDVQKNDSTHIHRNLPGQFHHAKTLRIRSSMQKIRVELDGITLFDNTLFSQDTFPRTPVASAWFLIDLPENSDNSLLDLYISTDVKAMSGRINEIYYGTRSDLIADLISRDLIGVFVILFVFSIAFYTAIVSLVIGFGTNKRLHYLSMFALTIGLWMLAEMDFIQLFISHVYFVGAISYLMLPLASIMFVLFIYEAALQAYGKLLKVSVRLIGLYLVSSIILQLFFGIAYLELIPVFIVILSITLLTIVILLILEIRKKSVNAVKYLAYIFVMLITEILETLMFIIGDFNNVSSLTSVGIMVFLLLVAVDTIIYMNHISKKEAESKYLKIVAYIDPLTQGFNRAAFERDVDQLLKSNPKNPFRLSMFDMNELKKINDLYGHEAGDEALKYFFNKLTTVFDLNASCYRIGGDEFMVIHSDVSEAYFRACLDQFESLLKQNTQFKKGSLEAAYGSKIYRFEESFGTFKHHVDQMMYANKNRQKKMSKPPE